MNRKLLTALATAGALSVGIGAAAPTAMAAQRTFLVTLLSGEKVTLTVDVPADLPAEEVSFPGLTSPVIDVEEITPGSQAAPAPHDGATPTPAAEGSPSPAPAGGTDGAGSDAGEATGDDDGEPQAAPQPSAKGQAGQRTRSRRHSGDPADAEPAEGGRSADDKRPERARAHTRTRGADGAPTSDNPAYSLARPGAAPIGVPNFFIDKFRIPPFLLPIYQAAGIQYGVRWEVLAAINEIETDYGRNLAVSSAGAVGWMQFLPSSWRRYGVDANKDGVRDPYNPVDAIFAAARYLRAAGADADLARAIFAYNHADWYVDSVLLRARLLGGLPSNFVGSLTGLTQGRFPVGAKATYADDLSEARIARRRRMANPAWLVQADGARRGINVYSRENAPVVAVQDGRIARVGVSARLGRFVQLQDAYGNTYTYGHLKSVARLYPAPRANAVTKREIARELKLPAADARPTAPATAGDSPTAGAAAPAVDALKAPLPQVAGGTADPPAAAAEQTRAAAHRAKAGATKERLFANPFRPRATAAGGDEQVLEGKAPRGSFETYRAGVTRVFGENARSRDIALRRLKVGARVVAGTVLGRVGAVEEGTAPHLLFEIRPAGRGAPRIDPKPILDGWKLLETTAIYRAAGRNPFVGDDARPTIGQVLLMSKEALQRQVLADPRVEIYGCGRRDIRLGAIDRRVLATIEFLSLSGLKPTITSLDCGHSLMTTSGNVSEHSSGNAVDIARINGIPIAGNQGPGSVTEIAVQRLLTLQGLMKPHQIITLMDFEGADNTFAMADHDDHIHVGFRPLYGTNRRAAKQVNAMLRPKQWIKLIDRLNEIDNPTVRLQPSKYAIRRTAGGRRASRAHAGE